jgi:4-hydroxy-tetrahydrodipicolinate reductase
MNIGIIGYGRMGKIIECLAEDRGHSVPVTVDPYNPEATDKALSLKVLQGLDAVIEFALPEGTEENVKLCLEAKVPMIIGTTGWGNIKERIGHAVEEAQGTVVYGSNFSIGAHIFFRTVQKAAALINHLPAYDIMMVEYHHNKKQDSPSGNRPDNCGLHPWSPRPQNPSGICPDGWANSSRIPPMWPVCGGGISPGSTT